MKQFKRSAKWHEENLKNQKVNLEAEVRGLMKAIDEYASHRAVYFVEQNIYDKNIRLGKTEW